MRLTAPSTSTTVQRRAQRALRAELQRAAENALSPIELEDLIRRVFEGTLPDPIEAEILAQAPHDIDARRHVLECKRLQLEHAKFLYKMLAGNQPLVQLQVGGGQADGGMVEAIFELLESERQRASPTNTGPNE